MFTLKFWKLSTERAVKTGAQFVIGGLVLSDAGPVDAFSLDWKYMAGIALGGIFMSYLTSLVTVGIGPDKSDPSAISGESSSTPGASA